MDVMVLQMREIEGKLHHIHRDLLEAKTASGKDTLQSL